MDLLLSNLISPVVLAFLLGLVAGFLKSDLEFPDPVLKLISIYLLLSIGLKGGHELADASFGDIAPAIGVTLILVLLLPAHAYFIARKVGKFDISNAGGIAALYGSVSSVTFVTAINFAKTMGDPAEGYLAALVAIMEWAIIVAIFIARFRMSKHEKVGGMKDLLLETLRSRGLILLSGGLFIGYFVADAQYLQIKPFFEDLFRGFLMLFLLEMGMSAAKQMKEFRKVGLFMFNFGILVPIIHGLIGVTLGTLAGMSISGAFVLGAVAASASYIDAPAAVRASLPKANPSIYLTASLGITFPFNLLVGIPIYYEMAKFMHNLVHGPVAPLVQPLITP
jgi:hypothetical protein